MCQSIGPHRSNPGPDFLPPMVQAAVMTVESICLKGKTSMMRTGKRKWERKREMWVA